MLTKKIINRTSLIRKNFRRRIKTAGALDKSSPVELEGICHVDFADPQKIFKELLII